MDFRPLTQDAIDAAPEWMREIPLRPDRWRDAHTRSVVGIEGEDAVAAGILWTSRVHGDRYWFEIAVAPDRRRRGLGREMFARLSALRGDDLAFMTRGYVDDDRMAFARALDARTIQVVPPADIAVASRTALRHHPAVRSAADVEWAQIAEANAAVYAWTHAAWSPVGPQFAEALNEDLADELDRDATSVAVVAGRVVAGRVVANCMVYLDESPPVVTAETTAADTPDGERLVEGCVRRSLDVLAARGETDVVFDGHVSDPHFLPVWTRLGPTGRWFHLVEVPAVPAPPRS